MARPWGPWYHRVFYIPVYVRGSLLVLYTMQTVITMSALYAQCPYYLVLNNSMQTGHIII